MSPETRMFCVREGFVAGFQDGDMVKMRANEKLWIGCKNYSAREGLADIDTIALYHVVTMCFLVTSEVQKSVIRTLTSFNSFGLSSELQDTSPAPVNSVPANCNVRMRDCAPTRAC